MAIARKDNKGRASRKGESQHSQDNRYIYTYTDPMGKRKVAEMEYSDMLHFYLHLVDEGIKVKTVESLHCVLHPAFDLAVRDEIIRKNPSDGVISEIKKRQGRKQKVQRH